MRELDTFIHEVAHLWESCSDNPFFEEFAVVSWEPGHVMREGNTLADFDMEYGMKNSSEDWATAVTRVLMYNNSRPDKSDKWSEKVKVIERFFDWLKKGE